MWDEQMRHRFQQLLQGQSESELSETEQAELASLVKELEVAEAVYLTPGTERLRQERETIEDQNRRLEKLVSRREALVQRLRSFLTEAQAEQRAIDRELTAVLAAGGGSNRDG